MGTSGIEERGRKQQYWQCPPAMLAYLEFAVTIHILPELIVSDVTKRICFYVRESIRAG
jgi:hypothetical protein